MIGLVLLLLLPTPTIWFSLDHKRNVSDGVVSGIGTLFSLDHKFYASDYDSDSDFAATENQPFSAAVLFIFHVIGAALVRERRLFQLTLFFSAYRRGVIIKVCILFNKNCSKVIYCQLSP